MSRARAEGGLPVFFADLQATRAAAARLDAQPLAGLLYPRLGPKLEEMRSRASERLHELLAQEYGQALDPRLSAYENDQECRRLFTMWNAAAHLELISSSTRSCALPHHRLCRAALREGDELLRCHPGTVPAHPRLEPWNAGSVFAEGLYRWRGLREDGTRWEFDVIGWPRTPRLDPSRPPLPATLAEVLVDHAGGLVPPLGTHPVAPVRITARPVRWAEVRLALGDSEAGAHRGIAELQQGLQPGALGQDTPALLSWHPAHRCVTVLGARLPTPPELWSAMSSGDIPPAEAIGQEWTSGFLGRSLLSRFRLAVPPDPSGLDVERGSETHWPAEPTCFRLVLPAE